MPRLLFNLKGLFYDRAESDFEASSICADYP